MSETMADGNAPTWDAHTERDDDGGRRRRSENQTTSFRLSRAARRFDDASNVPRSCSTACRLPPRCSAPRWRRRTRERARGRHQPPPPRHVTVCGACRLSALPSLSLLMQVICSTRVRTCDPEIATVFHSRKILRLFCGLKNMKKRSFRKLIGHFWSIS